METSSMGRAIDDLIAIGTASAVLADVAVFDGPWDRTQTPTEFVAIGLAALAGSEDSSSGVSAPHAMGGPLVVKEDYSIVCEIYVETGDTDQKWCRDRALSFLAVFEEALRTNANIGSSVLAGGAWVESVQLVQLDENFVDGRFCRIHWNVHVSNVLGN